MVRLVEILFCTLLIIPPLVAQGWSSGQVKISCPRIPRTKLIKMVRPKYPEEAKKSGIQGKVRLSLWIAKDGSVEKIEVLEGNELLAAAAIKAVQQWKYEPVVLNGKAVRADTSALVVFEIPKKKKPKED